MCLDTVNNAFTAAQTITAGTVAQQRSLKLVGGDGVGNPGGIYLVSATASGGDGATVEAVGQRGDSNGSSAFCGQFALAHLRTDAAMTTSGVSLGRLKFGGNPTDTSLANVVYSAQIRGYAAGAWSSSAAMPTGIILSTGSAGVASGSISEAGTDAVWLDHNGLLGIGVAPTAGNGLVQLASGTTKANGFALGDVNIFRNAAGSVKLGGNNAFASFTVDGNAAGSSGGAYIGIMNNGGSNTFLGNYSAIHGGAYDPIATIWGSAGIYIGAGALTKNIFIDSTVGGLTSSAPTGGVGYSTGAGGTVTQITSRTTGVTLNKITGTITLVSAAGSVAWQSFTVTNSAVAATDTIICNQVSGTDLNMIHVTAIAAGSFRISFATTAGVTVEQPVFRFTVIKSVSA